MFPNWTGWKSIKMLLTGAIAGEVALTQLPHVPTNWQSPSLVALAVTLAVQASVIAMSGTSMGPEIKR
jgi:hypothetical protein